MPKLSRWYVKSALVYLVIGALVAALALSSAAPLPPALLALRPLAWHLLTVGWVTQLIFGVAFWMFPLASKAQPRGDERLAWLAFWGLNTGLLLRAVGEPASALWPTVSLGPVLPLAATLQVLGVFLFVTAAWGRIRTTGRSG